MKKLAHSPMLLRKGPGLSFRWLSPTNCILSMCSGGFFQKVQRPIYTHLFPSMYSKGLVLCLFIPPLGGPMNLTAPQSPWLSTNPFSVYCFCSFYSHFKVCMVSWRYNSRSRMINKPSYWFSCLLSTDVRLRTGAKAQAPLSTSVSSFANHKYLTSPCVLEYLGGSEEAVVVSKLYKDKR